jgi:uncharacterized protein
MKFEWDTGKEALNQRKHKVSFQEAATVFGDPLSTTVPDPDHSMMEQRFLTVGFSVRHRPLIVSHLDRGDAVRIISARSLTKSERKTYEQKIKKPSQ